MDKLSQKQIGDLIEVFKAAIDLQLISKKEIIDWADKIILEEENPDIFFIELSLLGSKGINEISSHLSEYKTSENTFNPTRPLLGLINKDIEKKQLELQKTIRLLYKLKDDLFFTEIEKNLVYYFDHEYETAMYYADKNKILKLENRLLEFFNIYKSYTLLNSIEWGSFDKIVDEALEKFDQQISVIPVSNKPNNTEIKSWWKFW